jgi:hypothetical protein
MSKVSDKLSNVNDTFTVSMYDNGYMVEIGGNDHQDNWASSKVLCNTIDVLFEVIKEVVTLPRN